jgi:hypothetical protein
MGLVFTLKGRGKLENPSRVSINLGQIRIPVITK